MMIDADPRAARPDSRRLRPRRLSAHDGAGRGARRDARRDRPRRSTSSSCSRSPTTSPASGCAKRASKRAAPTTRPGRSTRGSRPTTARRSRSSSTTARGGNLVRHARRPAPSRGVRGDPGRARAGRRRAHDHPQVRARDRADGARRRGSSPRRSRSSAEHLEPGVTTDELDRIAEEYIRSHGGDPDARRATRASRRRSASRRTTWSSTGSRARTGSREGDLITLDVGVTLDGYVADTRVHVRRSARSPPRPQRLLEVCQAALAAGIEQAQVGQPARRHLRTRSSGSSRRPGSRSSAASSATGSAARYHEDPQIPNYGTPGPRARLSPGDDPGDRADDHGRRRRTS